VTFIKVDQYCIYNIFSYLDSKQLILIKKVNKFFNNEIYTFVQNVIKLYPLCQHYNYYFLLDYIFEIFMIYCQLNEITNINIIFSKLNNQKYLQIHIILNSITYYKCNFFYYIIENYNYCDDEILNFWLHACKIGNTEVIESFIIKKYILDNISIIQGIELCIPHDNIQIIKLLLNKTPIKNDIDGLIKLAMQHGAIKILQTLINPTIIKPKKWNDMLNFASKFGHICIIDYLCNNNVDSKCFPTVIRTATRHGHVNVIEYFNKKHNINMSHNILMTACTFGHLNIVKYIHNNGGNIHEKDDAAFLQSIKWKNKEIAKYLYENQCFPLKQHHNGIDIDQIIDGTIDINKVLFLCNNNNKKYCD